MIRARPRSGLRDPAAPWGGFVFPRVGKGVEARAKRAKRAGAKRTGRILGGNRGISSKKAQETEPPGILLLGC